VSAWRPLAAPILLITFTPQKLEAAKKKTAEEKLAKEVEVRFARYRPAHYRSTLTVMSQHASSKMAQQKISEKGRLVDEQKKDE
jgi:hypothetical protein